MFDIVHDWYLAVARENEIAVHAVDCEVVWDGSLGCCKTLCDDSASVDSASPWRVPEGPGIGKDVLERECQQGVLMATSKSRAREGRPSRDLQDQ